MSSILRSIAAIILGAMVTVLVISGFQWLGHQLFPPPTGLDFNNPETLKGFVDALPFAAKAMVVGSWCVGAYCGSWVACLIKPRYRKLSVVIVSALVVAGTIMVTQQFPHPQWMLLIGVLAPIPLGLLAERISR